MINISVKEDCGNAPKKEFIKDFNVAFANADTTAVLGMLTDDIEWTMVGSETIKGKNQVEEALDDMLTSEVTELTIDNIISHGDRCAANGVLKFQDEDPTAFCDMYVFDSHGKDAKIKQITSYAIDL